MEQLTDCLRSKLASCHLNSRVSTAAGLLSCTRPSWILSRTVLQKARQSERSQPLAQPTSLSVTDRTNARSEEAKKSRPRLGARHHQHSLDARTCIPTHICSAYCVQCHMACDRVPSKARALQ